VRNHRGRAIVELNKHSSALFSRSRRSAYSRLAETKPAGTTGFSPYLLWNMLNQGSSGHLGSRGGYFVQGTVLGSSRTENPAESAALASRWSPQMKLLLDGRCSHQIRDAASCRLSAARKECLSNNCVAKSRTWSSGRISLHPRLSKRRRATAPCLSRSVIS
jgi:hypothetical protein